MHEFADSASSLHLCMLCDTFVGGSTMLQFLCVQFNSIQFISCSIDPRGS